MYLGTKQARICVLGFSANRVWLVSRFLYFLSSVYLESTGVYALVRVPNSSGAE